MAYDVASLRRQLGKPVIRDGLLSVWRVVDVEGVLAHYVCGERTIDAFLQGSSLALNTDDRNLLEYAFAKSVGRRNLYSTHRLRNLAMQLGDHSPVSAEDVRLETIFERQLAMHLLLGGEVPVDESWSARQRMKAEAYNLYAAGRHQDAAARFEQAGVDSSCPIEAVVYAHVLAETGKSAPDDVLKMVSARSEFEATAARAIVDWRTGSREQASRRLLQAFELLRSDPWAMSMLIDAIVRTAIELAETDREAAQRLYEQTVAPFAMHRMNDSRLALRFLSAEQLGGPPLIEALESFEPHVLWADWFLEVRAKTYRTAKHPHSDAAQRDLRQYRSWSLGRN